MELGMQKFIPWASPKLFSLEKKLVLDALNSNWISGGYYIDKFENSLKKYLKTKYAFLVTNGTSALHLAYLGCGLKRNDEILIPAFGYLAAANIAMLMGLKIRFVDVDKKTFCMSLENLKKKVTKNTKAVVTINTYGNMYELKKISNFLKKKNIVFIEDAAESLGSKLNNKHSGTFGDIGTFSFHATKNLTTGEGGLVITNNKKYAKKIELYRSHGVLKKRYFHIVHGHNFRLTNFQAALGIAQLSKINHIIKIRKKIYKKYLSEIKKINKKIIIQKIENNCNYVPWTFALVIDNNFNVKRDKLIKEFNKKKIETRNGFYSPNKLQIFKNSKGLVSSDELSKKIICLPIHLNMKILDVIKIINRLKIYLN